MRANDNLGVKKRIGAGWSIQRDSIAHAAIPNSHVALLAEMHWPFQFCFLIAFSNVMGEAVNPSCITSDFDNSLFIGVIKVDPDIVQAVQL